jgi:hypothetical protein
VPFTVADDTGLGALKGCISAAELAAGSTAGVSGTALEDATAKAACLNSTDFKCPRVAMTQSVSPKKVATAVFRNRSSSRNTSKKQIVLHHVEAVRRCKLLKPRQMNSAAALELEQEPMNKFQLRNGVPKWNITQRGAFRSDP